MSTTTQIRDAIASRIGHSIAIAIASPLFTLVSSHMHNLQHARKTVVRDMFTFDVIWGTIVSAWHALQQLALIPIDVAHIIVPPTRTS
jgi:hypothetical protein